MVEKNFRNYIPTVLNNIQNNLTEGELNNIFTKNDIIDFLINRRNYTYEGYTYFLSPRDEEKERKAATEKWDSLTFKEKKEVISKWAKTILEGLVLNVYYPSSVN